MTRYLLLALLLSTAASAQDYPLTYTRQPRVAEDFANWMHWYDGGLPDRFTESDLVVDDLHGGISVIHDCTTKPAICAAHDGRVSPDGFRIAYTLAEGDALYPVKTWGDNRLTPAIEFQAVRYSLWIYDTVSMTKSKVLDNARMPDWYSNDGLVFASSRAGVYAPWAYAGREYGLSLQVYKATLKNNALTDIQQLTSGTYAMNPMVTTSGEICYSEWNGYGQRGVSHTPANQWWVACSNLDGTNKHYVLGAHGSPTLKTRDYLPTDARISGEGSDQLKLLRPVSELKRGKFAVSSYYRSNHLGAMGIIYGWTQTTAEGCTKQSNIPESVYQSTAVGTGRFVPCDIAALTPYGNSQDTTGVGSRIDKSGRAMGKAGYAAASPDGEYIFTHCRGSCYEGTMPEWNTRAALGGEPTAKFEIRKALVKRITDPFDPKQSVVIACADEKFNCRDARYVAPYSVLFGQDAPATKTTPATGATASLQIVNARAGELDPIPNGTAQDRITFQGNAVDGWQTKIAAIRIDRVYPWTTPPNRTGFFKTETVATCPLEADGSVICRFACGIDYQTLGVDAAGAVVATDNTLHRAICGEVTTCHGCHDAHSQERITELGKTALERWPTTIAGKKPAPPGC